MPVDLYELPIPDWGLPCPQCGYPLKHLPSHRCPECGLVLDMASLVPSWTLLREPRFDGQELPLPDYGRRCEGCDEALAGASERFCSACGQPFEPAAWQPSRPWFVVEPALFAPLPLTLVESIMLAEQVPHLARPGLSAFGIAGVTLLMPSEFYYECLWLIRRAQQRLAAKAGDPQGGSWLCGKCGEENPPNFEDCWSCGAASGGATPQAGPDRI